MTVRTHSRTHLAPRTGMLLAATTPPRARTHIRRTWHRALRRIFPAATPPGPITMPLKALGTGTS